MNEQLIKRLKSLAWRCGVVAATAALAYAAKPEVIQSLGLSETVTIFVGLVLSEVTKYLNTK